MPNFFQISKTRREEIVRFLQRCCFGSHLEIMLGICWESFSPPYQPPAKTSDKKLTARSLSLGKRKKFPVFPLPTSVSNVLIHSISWIQTCHSSWRLLCGYSSITLSFAWQSLPMFPGCRKDALLLSSSFCILDHPSQFQSMPLHEISLEDVLVLEASEHDQGNY